MKKKICILMALVLIIGCLSGCNAVSFPDETAVYEAVSGVWKYNSPTCGTPVYLFIEDEQVYVVGENNLTAEISEQIDAYAKSSGASVVDYEWSECAKAVEDKIISESNMPEHNFAQCKKGIVTFYGYDASGYYFSSKYDNRTILHVKRSGFSIQEDASKKTKLPLERLSDKITLELPEFEALFAEILENYEPPEESTSSEQSDSVYWTYSGEDGSMPIGTFTGTYTTNSASKSGNYALTVKVGWSEDTVVFILANENDTIINIWPSWSLQLETKTVSGETFVYDAMTSGNGSVGVVSKELAAAIRDNETLTCTIYCTDGIYAEIYTFETHNEGLQ